MEGRARGLRYAHDSAERMGGVPVPRGAPKCAAEREHENLERMAAEPERLRLAGNYNVEFYTPPAAKPEDTYSEIWIPLKKK